jgi:hypothetical protein
VHAGKRHYGDVAAGALAEPRPVAIVGRSRPRIATQLHFEVTIHTHAPIISKLGLAASSHLVGIRKKLLQQRIA